MKLKIFEFLDLSKKKKWLKQALMSASIRKRENSELVEDAVVDSKSTNVYILATIPATL